jgi:hypothetical protein
MTLPTERPTSTREDYALDFCDGRGPEISTVAP